MEKALFKEFLKNGYIIEYADGEMILFSGSMTKERFNQVISMLDDSRDKQKNASAKVRHNGKVTMTISLEYSEKWNIYVYRFGYGDYKPFSWQGWKKEINDNFRWV